MKSMIFLALHLKSHPPKPANSLLKFTHFSRHFSSSSSFNNNNNGDDENLSSIFDDIKSNNDNDDNNIKTESFHTFFSDIKSKLKQQRSRPQHKKQPPFQSAQPSPLIDVGGVPVEPTSLATSLTDIKSKLKQRQHHQWQSPEFLPPILGSSSSSLTPPSNSKPNDELLNFLSEIRLRSSPASLKKVNAIDEYDEEVARKSNSTADRILGFDGLSSGVSSSLVSSPKEDLDGKHLHPDNMSAQDKLKLEVIKLREKLKMDESDCGSTRVQDGSSYPSND